MPMTDARKCATCVHYWPKPKECRRHAPRPTVSVNIKQVPQATMWLKVDGEGCSEWASKNAAPMMPSPEDEE